MRKKFIIAALLMIIALVIYFILTPKDNNKELTLFGNVEIREVDLSFQVSGQIKKLLVEEGDHVKAGQLVAVLDDVDYKAKYEKSAADLEADKARAQYAFEKYDRHIVLCADNTTSKQECDNLRNSKNETKAVYESSIASKQYAKNQLDYTKIYAPSDGTVTIRIQEPGATVSPGQSVLTLSKDTPFWIRVYVPETNLGNVKYGMKAKVLTDTTDPETGKKREYEGWVGYISPVAEFTPKTVQTEDLRTDLVYRIRVYVYNVDEYLRQGMPTTVKINLDEKEFRKVDRE